MSFLYDEAVDGVLATQDKGVLVAELQTLLPDMELLHAKEDLRPFECDGLAAYRATPMMVTVLLSLRNVRPTTSVVPICAIVPPFDHPMEPRRPR